MLLPKGYEYNEAVQNPRIAFSDSDLKGGLVENNPQGLPKPYSGGFTITYKILNAQSAWAVRCFHRDITDLKKRYQTIESFLAKNQSSYFVDAKYLEEGIKINGKGFPVIKMRWLEGDPLNIYLSNNYSQSHKVERLITDFIQLTNELERFGIAHGDLQHGNIIVKNNKLYLIDYDGMYFPELASLSTNEIGHVNYQHPKRSASHYNKYIDRFSAIVIYVGLKAILVRPSLWSKYESGENILFRSLDYADLQSSLLIQELLSITELKPYVDKLIGCCYLDFDKIPSLNDFLSGNFNYDRGAIGTINITRSQYELIDGSKSGSILEHFGEKVEIVGKIVGVRSGYADNDSRYYFINFTKTWPNQTFTVVLWKEGIESFKSSNRSISGLNNQWVSVTGVVSKYDSKPQIIVEQATQIQILANETEASQRLKYKPTKTNVPLPQQPNKTIDKEADIFNRLYKNKPVYTPPNPPVLQTPKPTVPQTSKTITTQPKTIYNRPTTTYKPPATTYNTSGQANKTSTSSNSNNSGCIVPIVFTILGAIFIGAATDGKLWFVGAIGGGILGVWILSWFES